MTTWATFRSTLLGAIETYAGATTAVQWEHDDRLMAQTHVLLDVVSTQEMGTRLGYLTQPFPALPLLCWSIVRNVNIQVKVESIFDGSPEDALGVMETIRLGLLQPDFRTALGDEIIPEFDLLPTVTSARYESDGRTVSVYVFEMQLRALFTHSPAVSQNIIEEVNATYNIDFMDATGVSTVPTEIFFRDDLVDYSGTLRTSTQSTLFDSKQTFDANPLYFDDQEVSGSGTSSSHSIPRASSTLGVSNTTVGKRVRQTFQHFNSQSGKVHRIQGTFVLGPTVAGITKEIGYAVGDNGVFLRSVGGVVSLVLSSGVTGAAVETTAVQSDWSVDGLGEGALNPSGETVDWDKIQLMRISFLWQGAGGVEVAFRIGDRFYAVHQFHASNLLAAPFMSTPNLPYHVSIENDGTGPVASIEHFCETIISEGGHNPIGIPRHKSTEGTHVAATAADTLYAVIGIRPALVGVNLSLHTMSMIATSNDDFEWVVMLNPTVAGTFTYSAIDGSVQSEGATGATANTVTGGTKLIGGMAQSSGGETLDIGTEIRPGFSIAGVADTIVLCVRPLSSNANIEGSLHFEEL